MCTCVYVAAIIFMKLPISLAILPFLITQGRSSLCNHEDMSIIGSIPVLHDNIYQCTVESDTAQLTLMCIFALYPRATSLSNDCVTCTGVVYNSFHTDCIDMCHTNSTSTDCLDCVQSIVTMWRSECDPRGASSIYRVGLLTLIAAAVSMIY